MSDNHLLEFASDLPFRFCEKCGLADYDIRTDERYGKGEITKRIVKLYCKNKFTCVYLHKAFIKEGDMFDETD